MEALDAGKMPVFRAYQTTAEELFIREFVLKLKLGGFAPSYYKEKYGEDVLTRFAPQLKKLTAEGFMEIAGPDWVKLTREGLLQSDRICYEFFLPQHTQYARYT
jgi:oxygen-independent coproporphyrinogen-3 oxidase